MRKSLGYCVLGFEIVFSSWEWLFLFAAAFFLTSATHGGIISSVLFFTISVIRVLFAKKFATLIEKYSVSLKLRFALLSRFGLVVMAILLIIERPSSSYFAVFWMVIAGALYVFDSYASIDLRYILAENKHFSFGRIGAISNIGRRGAVAVTSIIALQISPGDWKTLGVVLMPAMLCGVISMLLICTSVTKRMPVTQNWQGQPAAADVEEIVASEAVDNIMFYLLGFNLFFGGSGLLIIKAISIYGLTVYKMNPLTVFYTGFVCANIFAMIFSKIPERFSDWGSIISLYVLSGVFCIAYWLFKDNIILFFACAVLFGIAYALQTVIVFVKISTTIQGNKKVSHLARIDTISRIGFIASQVIIGLLLDAGVDALVLCAVFGFMAIIAVGAFCLRKRVISVARIGGLN